MADKLESSILRNAIVPANAPILPFQAFVDAIPNFVNFSGGLNVSGKNIKTISSSFLNAWATTYFGTGFNGGDFSNNQLDAATITAILSAWSAVPGDPLDISGGTNAAPTYQPEFYRVQVPAGSSYSNNTIWNIHYDGWDIFITFKTGTALAGSSVAQDFSADQELWIGVSDSPTAAAIVNKIVALWATLTHKNLWSAAVGGASDQLAFSKARLFYSISIDTNTAAFTLLQHQAGSIDSTLDDVISNGHAASFNSGGAVVTLVP